MKRFASIALMGAFAVACGSGNASTVVEVPPPESQPQPQPVVVPALMRPGEEWIGHYTCGQGETDLDLHVERIAGDAIDATFEFSHEPTGAAGAYHMHGTLSPDGRVTLTPGAWIDRPPGYVGVGMHGEIHGATFSGRIDHVSCGTFSVQRR
jgi:hypothetical protein